MTHDDRAPRNLFDAYKEAQHEAANTPPVFDAGLGAQRRDDAIEQVTNHVDPEWMAAAKRAVEACALRYDYFSTDHVWQMLATFGCPTPAGLQKKAMVGAMRHGSDRGIIVKTDRYEPSRRPERHRGPVALWRSTIRTSS